MNDLKPWRKKEETEINLIVLFKLFVRQWKQILLCAVVLACLLCAYKFRKDSISFQQAENIESGEISIEMEDDQWRQVNTAVALRRAVEALQTYTSESILMQLDSSQVDQATLLYSIDDANKDDVSKIIQTYISYINDGAALETLVKADSQWTDRQGYLSELFSANRIDNKSKQLVTENALQESGIFYVRISGEDAQMTGQIMEKLQAAIDAYHADVKKVAGDYNLILLSKKQTVKADSDIADKQQNKITQLATSQVNLNNLTVNFDENQKTAYEQAYLKESSEDISEDHTEVEEKPGISKKWLLLSFSGGIFIYCVIFVCWYLLRDTVKNVEELRENYYFPVYGGVRLYKGKKATGEELSAVQKDNYEREKAQMLGRIRLSCQQQGITELCLATDFSLNEQEKEFMTAVSKQLSEWKIKAVLVENITGNISMWDTMTDVGNLLLVCRINKTTHKMIDEEMAFFAENHLEVLGAVALDY